MDAFPGHRARLSLFLTILALSGCAGPRLEVASAPSEPSTTLTEAGIQLTILPNTWSGYPSNLRRHFTPVEIQIQNDRPDEIQVRYGDFQAVDEARNQYRAVSPGEVTRALFGALWPYGDLPASHSQRMSPHPPLLAGLGPWWWYGYWPSRPWYPYYGPFYPDPFFSDYPSMWYRPTGYDILTRGLREGRVLSGARVQGFLYFQLATQTGPLLWVTWTPSSADGKPLATFSAELRIVP